METAKLSVEFSMYIFLVAEISIFYPIFSDVLNVYTIYRVSQEECAKLRESVP